MDLFTHFLLGAVIYTSVFGQMTADLLYIAAIFAVLPDFDILLRPLQRWCKSPYLEHRGGSHSYIIGIMVSFLVNLVYAPVTGHSFFLGWLIGSLFYGLHISMDLLTTTQIPILYPFSKKEPSFYVEKAGSMFTMGLSAILLGILVPLYTSERVEMFRSVSLGVSVFFGIYYLYRILLKRIVSRNFTPTQKYLPGILPIFYLVLDSEISENSIKVNLTKHNVFGKSRPIFNFDSEITISEYQIYQKALLLCNQDYYRNKWTKAPVLVRENNHLSVKLYFLETVMNGRTMNMHYDYDYSTEKISELDQGYGKISAGINK